MTKRICRQRHVAWPTNTYRSWGRAEASPKIVHVAPRCLCSQTKHSILVRTWRTWQNYIKFPRHVLVGWNDSAGFRAQCEPDGQVEDAVWGCQDYDNHATSTFTTDRPRHGQAVMEGKPGMSAKMARAALPCCASDVASAHASMPGRPQLQYQRQEMLKPMPCLGIAGTLIYHLEALHNRNHAGTWQRLERPAGASARSVRQGWNARSVRTQLGCNKRYCALSLSILRSTEDSPRATCARSSIMLHHVCAWPVQCAVTLPAEVTSSCSQSSVQHIRDEEIWNQQSPFLQDACIHLWCASTGKASCEPLR